MTLEQTLEQIKKTHGAKVARAFEAAITAAYGEELARCQRYFYAPGIAYSTFGNAVGTGSAVTTQIFFPTTMRATPTIVASLSGGVNTSGGTAMALGVHAASHNLSSAAAGGFGAVVNWTSFNSELTA